MHWLDAERESLPAVARIASTLRPGLTIELPRLLDRYLHSRGRIAEVIPLAELARRTAARVGDRHGEVLAWACLGTALNLLRRYDEAVRVYEQALSLMSGTGDRDREGRTGRNLGHALRSLSRYPEAIAAYDRARILFRGAASPSARAMSAKTWPGPCTTRVARPRRPPLSARPSHSSGRPGATVNSARRSTN